MVTLQEYARKQLMRTEEGMSVHRAHAEFVLALAIDSDAKLVGTEQKRSFDRLNAEYNNIRAALTWTSSARRWNGPVARGRVGAILVPAGALG